MTPEVQARILDRLTATDHADDPWALMLLAAMEGEETLNAYLEGEQPVSAPERPEQMPGPRPEPPGAYLSAITVEGFRGVGPAAKLTLLPGPGLTLVVGRNGSGKSSFAEGLEYLLTGRNYRWEKRPKVWVEGWRNLHHDKASLKVDFHVEGKGTLLIARTWQGTDLSAHQVLCVGPAKKPESLEALGWTDALTTFRPFLSYNELGSLLDEGPSKLYDALSKVLGLEELVRIQDRLATARKARKTLVDDAGSEADRLCGLLAQVAEAKDDRIAKAKTALCGKKWDLPALQKLVDGNGGEENSAVALLRQLTGIASIDVARLEAAAGDLRSAVRAFEDVSGTDAARAKSLADILDAAMSFHEKHAQDDCPVCKAPGAVAGAWADGARDEVARLRRAAAAYEAASRALDERMRAARALIAPPPPALGAAAAAGVRGLEELRRLWSEWAAGRELREPLALAAHLEERSGPLSRALEEVRENAADMLRAMEDLWTPLATDIRAWLPVAKKAVAAKTTIKQIKAAEEWWKDATAALRDERFAPIADGAREVWSKLRLQSNVDLGGVALEGTAQRRRVTLQVTVDGTPAEALGVMSQGELHSLALSLFLPRATLAESPFRFICVDDPVQSMDPARVEGLARILADTAKTRQVIVFTHDDRLPEAVRRLGLPATIYNVTRRAKSVVEVRQVLDPVSSLIDDARAVALTKDLRTDVASRVVPGFCRAALEASCMETVRRRRLGRGEAHESVEDLLAANAKLYPLVSLALFDDPLRTNDVTSRLRKFGVDAVEILKTCNTGVHERFDGDLNALVDGSHRLARHLLELS